MKKVECPQCRQSKTTRAAREGVLEKTFFVLIGLRPYRCRVCRRRFRSFGKGSKNQKGVTPGDPGEAETRESATSSQAQGQEFEQLIAEIRRAEQVKARQEGSPKVRPLFNLDPPPGASDGSASDKAADGETGQARKASSS